MPAAAAACGNKLVEVMPGMVLISKTYSLPRVSKINPHPFPRGILGRCGDKIRARHAAAAKRAHRLMRAIFIVPNLFQKMQNLHGIYIFLPIIPVMLL